MGSMLCAYELQKSSCPAVSLQLGSGFRALSHQKSRESALEDSGSLLPVEGVSIAFSPQPRPRARGRSAQEQIGASVSDADLPLSVVQLQRIVKQHCTALHCPALCCSPPIQVIPRVLFRCHASYECGAPDVVPLLAFSSFISLSL